MATQHVSIWRDEFTDLSNIEKRSPIVDANGVITSNGNSLVINTLGTGGGGANFTSNVYFYDNRTADKDVYQSTNSYSNVTLSGGTATTGEIGQASGQSFTATSTVVYGATFYFVKTGTPTDSITVSLCSDLAGTNVLASRTLTTAQMTAAADNAFVFGDVAVTPGTVYYLQIQRSGARDAANCWQPQFNTADGYAGGARLIRSNMAWTATTGDLVFRVFGRGTFDLSGGKELFWEFDPAASNITSDSLIMPTFDIFDKTAGTYSKVYSSGRAAVASKLYWRVTGSTGLLRFESSTDGNTWTNEFIGPSLNASQMTSINLALGYVSSNGSVYALKYFSYGTQETVATQGIKYWNGTAWVAKPVKYWNGTAWVQKPAKRWDGSQWVTPTY